MSASPRILYAAALILEVTRPTVVCKVSTLPKLVFVKICGCFSYLLSYTSQHAHIVCACDFLLVEYFSGLLLCQSACILVYSCIVHGHHSSFKLYLNA